MSILLRAILIFNMMVKHEAISWLIYKDQSDNEEHCERIKGPDTMRLHEITV